MDNSPYRDHNLIGESTLYSSVGSWTENVSQLLTFLMLRDFESVSLAVGFSELEQVTVYLMPYEDTIDSVLDIRFVDMLISAAKLLCEFHDVSVDFLSAQNIDHKLWQLKARDPFEVICHGDFAPYSVVHDQQQVTGIIDFDTAHPGPRVWDLAYAIYCWAPLSNPDNKDGFGNIDEQLIRAKLFLDSYDLDMDSRIGLAQLIIERLEALIDFMFTQAKIGNRIHKINIENSHHLQYQADIAYIKANKFKIERYLYC